MKLAIISDVHSNLHALEAVLNEIDRFTPEMTVCAGDVVGYGAYPNECCEMLRDRNHDSAVLDRDLSGANPYAARAILWTSDVIKADSRKYLESLGIESRFSFGGRTVAMFHGSPSDPNEYVFEYDVDDDLLKSAEADVLILGHTHVPCVKKLSSGLFINPGSVGQPRDSEWKASFAILDSDTNECIIMRVPYDLGGATEAIRNANLPSILAERLFYGT
jgi:putative phosphoesterase